MAHVGIITSGLTGMVNASLQVAQVLENEGFQITYMCPYDKQDLVESYGFTYVQLPEIHFEAKEFSQPSNRLRAIWNYKSYNKKGVEQVGFEKYAEIISGLDLDFLLIDVELHEIILPAYVTKVRIVLLSQWFSFQRGLSIPPLGESIVPNGLISKIKIALSWEKAGLRLFKEDIKRIIFGKVDRRAILNTYVRKIGFPRTDLIPSQFPPIFNYKNFPILSLTMSELDFPHTPPPNFHHVGASVFANSMKQVQLNDPIQEIFTEKESTGKKLIYCSVSSFKQGDLTFLKRVISAFKEADHLILVVSLGSQLEVGAFAETPSNVHIFDWLPQLSVLQQSDCSINHGGIHTINECIYFGVPMLVYSGKKFDQNGCAARVQFHGLGLVGDKDKDDPTSIRSKIDEILSNEEFRNRAIQFQKTQIGNLNDKLFLNTLKSTLHD